MAIILYARKSVENDNSVSCDTQLEYCRSMIRCDERQEEIITLVDNGFSGGSIHREGFQTMMKLVRENQVSKVIVYKVDRFSRSFVDFAASMELFKKHHVKFVSSQEAFDSSSSYGEMILQILMVFAQFERTSIIDRITQAYAYRSDLGFYMGGNRPFGYELVPTEIQHIKTKMYRPVPAEAELLRQLFSRYSEEHLSLRQLQKELVHTDCRWSSAKLSAILKNPIYVKADAAVYDYYDSRAVHMVNEPSLFVGHCGAQLYGRHKHDRNLPDWSDMKLVLLPHEALIDSETWLRCQHKLERNRQIRNAYNNPSSWLAGMIHCAGCGYRMTTIKGSPRKSGPIRRYFHCSGKSHRGICPGPSVSIYAEDLENFLFHCIREKLHSLNDYKLPEKKPPSSQVQSIRGKLRNIEKSRQQLAELLLSENCSAELLPLLNEKALRLKQEETLLTQRLEGLVQAEQPAAPRISLAAVWEKASYNCRKSVAALLLEKITISLDGSLCLYWNI